jgi:hypothetical protein
MFVLMWGGVGYFVVFCGVMWGGLWCSAGQEGGRILLWGSVREIGPPQKRAERAERSRKSRKSRRV